MPLNPEYEIQKAVAKYLDWLHVLWSATSNGMKLQLSVAKKLKAAGYKAGQPDLFIFEPKRKYHGMAMELKASGGRTSDNQAVWKEELQHRGYHAVICPKFKTDRECYEWAIEEINKYLGV